MLFNSIGMQRLASSHFTASNSDTTEARDKELSMKEQTNCTDHFSLGSEAPASTVSGRVEPKAMTNSVLFVAVVTPPYKADADGGRYAGDAGTYGCAATLLASPYGTRGARLTGRSTEEEPPKP
jgi:ATP phosphoribosyltransferase regulatory subunit HisZ